MSKTYNWGIIGLGKIANKFVKDLKLVEGANLYAVASRSLEKAKSFSKLYQADKYYGSYKELAEDPNVDVIYIATPHAFHHENTLMCLEAGKAVLCEKAFGMNKREVESMINKSREKGIFLMEALWTRFIPATNKVLELLNSGLIGELQSVRADFGFKAEYDPQQRVFNKQLGGGSLLDIGIYPIFLSLLTMGVPEKIHAMAIMSPTGVDNTCMMLFDYNNGKTAALDSSLMVSTPVEGWLHGDKGSLKLHHRFHHTKKISHYKDQKLINTYEVDFIGNGYYHEIVEVMICLKAGAIESKKLPLSFSLDLITTLDRVRESIGLTYND